MLAKWFHEEWGIRNPANSQEFVEKRLRQRLKRVHPPLTMVAFLNEILAASASIKIREMETHPQFEHWLGAVYVKPEYRGAGIGSKIVQHTVSIAQQIGINQLYLYTRSHEDFYTHLGWQPIERPQYHGRPAVIMKQTLI